MPNVPSPGSYRRQLEEWTRILADSPAAKAAIDEIENVANSVIRSLGVWANVQGIDEKLKAWNTIDPTGIHEAISILTSAPSDPMTDERENESYVDRLRGELHNMPRIHGNDELPSSFQMLDYLLEHALLNISDRWEYGRLTALVARHLEHVSPAQTQKIWNAMVWECDTQTSPDVLRPGDRARPDEHPENEMRFLVKGTPSMPEDYFVKPNTAKRLRERIAEYVAWWRTRLYRDAARRGRRQFFSDRPIGLGRVLTLKSTLACEEPSEPERALAMSLGRLCVITTESQRLYYAAEATLGLERSGTILGVHARVRVRGQEDAAELPRERYLLFHLSRLLWACEELVGSHPRIRHLLNRYKLRLELSTKEILKEIPVDETLDSAKELAFQADLCRFLLIHGVQGVGTKIGASQTDVVVADESGLHLFETKLCRQAPSAEELMQRLPQVSTYQQDFQHPPASSTLVVLNVSKTLLTGPPQLKVGDTNIVFINLVADPASKRRRERRFDIVNGHLVSADNVR